MTDLRFTRLLDTSSPVNLKFGEVDATGQEGLLSASVGVRADLQGLVLASGSLAVTLGLTVAMSGTQAANATVTFGAQAGGGWQEAAKSRAQVAIVTQATGRLPVGAAAAWADATKQAAVAAAAWQSATPAASGPRLAWAEGAHKLGQGGGAWQEAASLDGGSAALWAEAQRGPGALTLAGWQEITRVATQQLGRWEQGQGQPVRGFAVPWGLGAPRPVGAIAPWQQGKHPDPGVSPSPPLPPLPPDPHVCYIPPPGSAVVVEFSQAATVNDTRLEFICEDAPAGVVVPVKRVYIVRNNVSLVRVSDGADIPVLAMSLSLDVDSWTWGFSASLPGAALALVGSEPIELEARINGAGYRVLSESVSSERVFGQATIAVQGRGRSAVLDAPYCPVLTFGNPSAARTAQQLMADALALTGWSATWGLTDWVVPAGSWSFQGARIGALTAIAAAAGGYIQPHPTTDTVRVLPRYPAVPWAWGGVTPDYTLPAAVVQREGIAWTKKPSYNRVFVSGTSAGVLGQVTRDGTAGDLLAPMVTDMLMTDAIAVRQRGTAVLSDGGTQAAVRLRLPVLPETGIILPGKFVSYVDGSTTRLGIVRSVSVEAGRPEVWQTLGIETHVSR